MTLAIRLGVVAAVLMAAASARADQATDAFNSLYGDEVKRVLATPTGADDAALAARLLEAARTPGNPSSLVAVLCQNAYDLAMKDSSGLATAVAAMELLAEKVPEKKAECAPKILAVQVKMFAAAKGDEKAALGEKLLGSLTAASESQAEAGDLDGAVESVRQALGITIALGSPAKAEVQARFAALYVRQQKQKQVAALKAKLEANPQDAAARKDLLKLYLVDMDNPAEAAKLLDASADDTTRKLLPDAAKPIDQTPEAACAPLGDWYRGMADQSTAATAKGAMLARARAYYQRFVELHAADDLPRTTATLALAKVEEAIAALPAGSVPALPVKWTDCMPLINPDRHTIGGKWEARDGAFVNEEVRSTWAILLVPMSPTGSYEFEAAFVRTKGGNTINIHLPMGKSSCCVALSNQNGEVSGIDKINNKGPRENESGVRPGKLENGRLYVVAAKVLPRGDDVEVSVTLDGKPYFKWRGPVSALSPGVREGAKLKALEVSIFGGVMELRRARLRMISGEMRPAGDALPPPPESAVAVKPPESKSPGPKAPESKPVETPAAPEIIGGTRFFGVAAKTGGGGGLVPGPDGWFDYMEYVYLEKDAVAGKWSLAANNTAIVVASGDKNSRMVLPITAPGSYELEVTFTRTLGTDAVVLLLPVGRAACALLLGGEGGAASGLDLVNNKPYKDNETSVRPAMLFNDSKYTVLVRVLLGSDEAEVIVTLKGKPYIKWKGPPSALARSAAWKLPDARCPGLGSCDSAVIFHSVRMRTLPVAAAAGK
ncbi:MAG: hypothetical protein NT049_12635 [Planctomycetota bacterium]|nr:hypothetical protein [Planctomycetota bacterium]